MDNNKKLLEGLLKADGINPAGATESERIAFIKMLDKQSESKQPKPGSQPGIWRLISQSRIAKVAAVAVIITGFMLLMYRGNGTIDIATPAFSQIREALTKVTWVHTVEVKRVKNKGRYEKWLHFDSSGKPKIGFSKSNGQIMCSDYVNCLYIQYVPDADAKVITYRPEFHDPWFVFNPQHLVDTWVERFEKSSAVVTHQASEHKGIEVDVYCATDYETSDDGERHLRSEFRLIVDRKRHVPIATSFKFWMADGMLTTNRDKKYDYPENGPKSLNELGVPKSAKVIDNSRAPELLEAVAGYRAGRDNSPLRYIAILVCSIYEASSGSYLIDGVDRYCSDGHLQRCDLRFLKPLTEGQFRAEAGNSFDSIMNWWTEEGREESRIRYEWLTLYGEERVVRQRRSAGKTDWVTNSGYSPSKSRGPKPLHKYVVDRDILSELGWTRRLMFATAVSWKISIVEDDYSINNNLICIETLGDWSHLGNENIKHLLYLNPERDYICQRQEMHRLHGPGDYGECFSARDVLEYGRTDTGQWYPKRIFERSKYKMRSGTTSDTKKILTVYLATEPEFPEGLFDPEKLPK